MRKPRLKLSPADTEAAYHCMSRTVNGERLFDLTAREVLRNMIWQVAEYCGIQVLTYAILSNHFHLLVRVPGKDSLSDEELLRRYSVLYPKPTRYQTARLGVIRQQLAVNGPEAVDWRRRQSALMGDISPFMQILKERFTIWFNRTHERFGTLWSERFKSVLVEPRPHALRTMAAYIDLNAVRAGLARDPRHYRFCGYGEAVAGEREAQAGLQYVLGSRDWESSQASYRELLFGMGAGGREHGAIMDREALEKVIREHGRLPLAAVLRCRIRHLSDGAILGSKAYVSTQLAVYRRRTGRRKYSEPRPLPSFADWGDLAVMRGLRRQAYD
jgi:putative transposase